MWENEVLLTLFLLVSCCLCSAREKPERERWRGWCYCGDGECTRICAERAKAHRLKGTYFNQLEVCTTCPGHTHMCACVSLSSVHRATLSPFLRGIWDDSRGPGASGGETNANTVHIVCRCVVIRGGALKEWGRRRSHDMSGMVTVILFFFSPLLSTVS